MNARSIPIGMTICAAAAIGALSMLPAEHVHTSDAHPPIVHRHVVDEAAEHEDIGFDHGDHHDLKTLEQVFVPARHYDLGPPLITGELLAVTSDRHPAGWVRSIDALNAHGPPLRIGPPLRAPPA